MNFRIPINNNIHTYNPPKGIKRIFLLILPFFLTLALIFYSFKESQLYSSTYKFKSDLYKGINDEVVSPSAQKREKVENFDNFISRRSFNGNMYVEGLLKDWNTLFDLFASNANFKQRAKNINVKDLERISEKVGMVSREFKLGNVDNLVNELGDIIKRECNYYKLDWRIVLAIVRQESYFNANARSHAGAFGLMQLMPRTGEGLQNTLKLDETQTPVNNLIAGIYYYASLVSQFREFGDDKYKFALAAYNAGLGRVIDAMTITAYFNKDYKLWENVKEAYPFLSSKEDSIHALVWPDTKHPPYGTLDNWKEPYNYVNSIDFYYESYKKMFASNLEEPKSTNKKTKKKKK
ncbi:MAG: transglycosylase SLT domain-containing protein [Bacteroidetes bacterium]|nr:transglycosylase SLT domain-containing protein [Bacteroidota bacterium]